jgi:hypothetical protein
VPKRPKGAPAAKTPVEHARNVDLRNALARVLEEWVESCRQAPWHVEPVRFGTDALNEVTEGVLDVAMAASGDYTSHERLVRAAIAHGSQRRTQDTEDASLLREYHALREALWRFMERSGVSPEQALPAILRVDVAISVATTAALRGYHRTELEPAASWEPRLLRHIHDASARLASELDDSANRDHPPRSSANHVDTPTSER